MYNSILERYKPARYLRENLANPCPMVGGIPALQFINTVRHRRGIDRKDYLKIYEDFLSWCHDAGLITLDDYHVLDLEAYSYVADTKQLYNRMINFRDSLYEIVDNLYNGRPPHEMCVAYLDKLISEAHARQRFKITEDGVEKEWIDAVEEPARPLWMLALHVDKLLQAGVLKKVKRCSCGNFYLDDTKNGSRKWCSQRICGNAARKRLYRGRKRMG